MKPGFLLGVALALSAVASAHAATPDQAALDAFAKRAMDATHSQGLAIALIDHGKVAQVRSYGARNAAGDPLQTDTVMYGASLTKAVVAYTVMQLVEERKLDLDTSIAEYLPRPLPEYADEDRYAPWSSLAGDERWRAITPRILLTHSAGFANFHFLEPDNKLHFHFDPGSRFAYSGDGMILLQFVLERGLGLDLGAEMRTRVFDRHGMANTSMTWRADFADNLANGWKADGGIEAHDERSTVRAAGSMDTTIADMANFAAAYIRGEGLSAQGAAQLIKPSLPITTASQFPTLQPELPTDQRRPDLAAGLGVVVFDGPQGHGFFKGGHNDSTANTWVCIETSKRCVVILSNDVRSEAAFPALVAFVLGETGTPWSWEYGGMEFWKP